MVVDFVKTKAIAVTDGVTEESREVHTGGLQLSQEVQTESDRREQVALWGGCRCRCRQHRIAVCMTALEVEKRQRAKVGARIKCWKQKKEEC